MIPQPEPTVGDSEWFVRDRFGLFIHWGIYSLAARLERCVPSSRPWAACWARSSPRWEVTYYFPTPLDGRPGPGPSAPQLRGTCFRPGPRVEYK